MSLQSIENVIAIDGPAGSGKSTLARMIATKLGYHYLDSGAFYRALTFAIWEKFQTTGEDESKFPFFTEKLADACLLEKDEVEFGFSVSQIPVHCELSSQGENVMFLGERDISHEIRDPEITKKIRYIAPRRAFREILNRHIREFARTHKLVMDGRDIGTEVFPKSKFKFFLTASVEVRAKRRYDELVAKGFKADLNHIKEEIVARDESDTTRTVAPLKQASDAILIDTSTLDTETVLNTILSKVSPSGQI
ncbi:(d)CMP kinase [Leptospira levettii]|uniref:(d)CMP kinase n=1 Tax=Leptospira levettii TaxID=2023178 RepID=UPI001082E59F|nr:(d)CMP kinase [Leptospira levettii]TGM31205.1 (d)CMP kinase [Leptospira levettii]TGM66229.1 (d)CMP kinase [Leptospira levettii]